MDPYRVPAERSKSRRGMNALEWWAVTVGCSCAGAIFLLPWNVAVGGALIAMSIGFLAKTLATTGVK